MATSAEPLRVSDFHIIDRDGGAFVWIVPASTLFSVDDTGRALLTALVDQRGGEFNAATFFRSLPSDASGDAADTLAELRGLGILSSPMEPKETDLVRDDLLARSEPPLASVTAMVSGGCNLNCPYCYAERGGFGRRGQTMSFEVGRRLIDLLLAESGDIPAASFTFHGGEPLLNMRVIRRLVAYGEERSISLGKRIRFGLTTNGLLLTPEFIDYFIEHNIAVKISIDGPDEIHDRVRTDALGHGTYERVLRAAAPLIARRPTQARVTVTRKSLEIMRIVDHLLEVGFAEVGVSPVSSTDPAFALTTEDHAMILREYRRLASRVIDEAKQGRAYAFANLINLMRQIHHGRSQRYPCGAGIGLLAADGGGTLFPCHRFPGEPSTRMGDVEAGIDRARQTEWLERLHVDRRSDCADCWARYICSGGCYYLSAIEYGDAARTYTPICDHLREWYELGIVTYARLAERPSGSLDCLRITSPEDEILREGDADGTFQTHQQEGA